MKTARRPNGGGSDTTSRSRKPSREPCGAAMGFPRPVRKEQTAARPLRVFVADEHAHANPHYRSHRCFTSGKARARNIRQTRTTVDCGQAPFSERFMERTDHGNITAIVGDVHIVTLGLKASLEQGRVEVLEGPGQLTARPWPARAAWQELGWATSATKARQLPPRLRANFSAWRRCLHNPSPGQAPDPTKAAEPAPA